jgi:hypothetical protein
MGNFHSRRELAESRGSQRGLPLLCLEAAVDAEGGGGRFERTGPEPDPPGALPPRFRHLPSPFPPKFRFFRVLMVGLRGGPRRPFQLQ